jgi:type I restriction enzyme S subunit
MSEMADTGIPWIGIAPRSWPVKRLRWTVESARNGIWGSEPDGENDIPCVRVADFDRVAFRVSEDVPTIRSATSSERRGRVLSKGDLLLEKSGGGELQPVGAVAIYDSEHPAVCSNFLARLVPASDCNSRFLSYLHAHLYSARVNVRSIKQTTGIQNLDAYSYFCEQVPVPPLSEQRTIAAYLDNETDKIDRLIAEKIAIVKRLDEKRTTIISHATTQGFNWKIPFTRVETPWLNQIPSHWQMMPLKHTSKRSYKTFTDGDWIEAPFITDSGVRLIQTGNIGIGRFREQGHRYVSEETFFALRCTEVSPGDVLICRLDGPVGRACLAPKLADKMITSVDNAILCPSAAMDARFLVYLLSSSEWLGWIASLCRVGGGFRLRVSRSMLGNFRIPVPPKEEQSQIADVLDMETEEIATLILQVENGIRILREYRSALISAAVRGQIDIRYSRREAPCP